jgi:hypothetical protein
MNSNRAFVFVLAISGASWTVKADAHCNQTNSAAQSDKDLWKAHGCRKSYFMWHYKAYQTTSGDWGGRGFYDACNLNTEYAKHWSSAWLITWGTADDNNHSFHSVVDYQEMARARSSNEWHDGFHHQAADDPSRDGDWHHAGAFGNSLLITDCPLYDVGYANAGPGSRAGDFVHEATHAWMFNHRFDPSHHTRPTGNKTCTVSGANCDYFYWHKLRAYQFGDLWQQDGTGNRFHSPNQSQVEFLCDLADFPAKWVTTSIRIEASHDANKRATSRFINGPGYSCGNVRPW